MASGWDMYSMYGLCGDDVIDAPINEAGDWYQILLDDSQNIFQSVLVKQFCSLASASSDHFRVEHVTGTSCLSYGQIWQIEGDLEFCMRLCVWSKGNLEFCMRLCVWSKGDLEFCMCLCVWSKGDLEFFMRLCVWSKGDLEFCMRLCVWSKGDIEFFRL
jgi:hypothetical protein